MAKVLDREEEKLPIRRSEGLTRFYERSPFAFLRRFTEEMDRLTEDFGFSRAHGRWYPAIEMFERDNHLVVRCDLPGMKRDDINVETRENMLIVSGERNEEHKEEREGFYHTERRYGSFYRAIDLPGGAKPDEAKATFKEGVLEVTMPTEPSTSGRRIEVR